MKDFKINALKILCTAAVLTGISACSDSDIGTDSQTEMMTKTFEVTLVNLTQGQPFSPPALLTHGSDMTLWSAGSAASNVLEQMAEGGNAMPLADMDGITKQYLKDAAVAPANKTSWTFEIDENSTDTLSVATMLVNTNDAFAGITGVNIASFELDEMHVKMLSAYDAGTEQNDEVAIPGPARQTDAKEGFNAARTDDVDRVHIHPGILTAHELTGSVLLPEHKFDNPVAKLIIKRVQ